MPRHSVCPVTCDFAATAALGDTNHQATNPPHNPSVVGSSPTRPTCELRKRMIADFMIRDRGANGRRHDPSRTAARSNETSPGGSLRVKVYAGFEPLSGKRHCLDEVVSAGSRAAAEAEKVRTAFLHEVDERRNPKTRAKVNQLL